MKIRFARFNLYLGLAILGISLGCKTPAEKKHGNEAATLRLHLEVNPDGTPHNLGVPILRENPVWVNVEREPFLTEADLQEASVVEAYGGFAIRIQFNRHGALLLENATTAYRGRRIAVQSHFGETRWLAAPKITTRITNGLLVFTPDASRQEADRIVLGLNNIVKALK